MLNAVMLSIDFEKAFDRVEYSSSFKAMKFLNFGDQLIQWVEILFDDFNLCTTNNGYLSPFFQPTRGLFQGNPFSCYGFIIVIELLGIMIRQSKDVEPIRVGKMVSLLAMFADDLNIFLFNKAKGFRLLRVSFELLKLSQD